MLPSTDRSAKLWDSNEGNAVVPCVKQHGLCGKVSESHDVLCIVQSDKGTVTGCPSHVHRTE